ncbi:thiamine pyrophosphate-binding protein [Paraburkholderia caribensis]|uniref:thiamine pyrophosphate-binding protein n=1 Tax=Paraburkholderia caribensis TaxID=75105 RepID=UPI001CB4F12B|nr:thiamine pyrophosphate-binding protein [Paraburkholderia caribensis]CAG9262899.1 Thiamine pyrophosphate-requiring pyruvate decarboxylase [Paraburkholderia caribensis]
MNTLTEDQAANAEETEGASGKNRDNFWGSDGIAELLQSMDIPFLCLNPGSSFRGLHDSIVNHTGNTNPEFLLCLHEEHAVAIAHGYAKVKGAPLAVALHSNVGLMHASMAIYNAWCDRVPMLILGAHGPVDAAKRRPWIDWIHTSQDTAALVRPFVKWDNQPLSVDAAYEAMLRAFQITRTQPCAPVYVCLDVTFQETRLPGAPHIPEVARYAPPAPSYPRPADIDQAVRVISRGKRLVMLIGRVSRDPVEWRERIVLAERLGATVLTDLKTAASFPTDHPQHPHPPAFFVNGPSAETLRQADTVLALDWVDLAGTLKAAWPDSPVSAQVISVSLDHTLHNGWSFDHQGLPSVDVAIASDPGIAVRELLVAVPRDGTLNKEIPARVRAAQSPAEGSGISMETLASALREATRGVNVSLLRLPLGWSGELWNFRSPLDYLGYDGGAGIGSGPGMAVGAALALKHTGRLAVAILGDGDFLMGNTALWSAAHFKVPLLVIVANNQSFYNDEVHQERVALERGRPVENKWIGQRISSPLIDLAAMARAQGFTATGPVRDIDALDATLAEAVRKVREGGQVAVDVHVKPGYAPSMSQGMTAAATTPAVR